MPLLDAILNGDCPMRMNTTFSAISGLIGMRCTAY